MGIRAQCSICDKVLRQCRCGQTHNIRRYPCEDCEKLDEETKPENTNG